MKFCKTLLVTTLAVVTLAWAGAQALHAAPAPSPGGAPTAANASDAEIKTLVGQLGDADYQTRENAEKKLKEIGAPAADELTKAMDSDDAEVKDRATRLVQNMRREAVRKDFTWKFPFDNASPLAMPLTLGDGVLYAVAANAAGGTFELSIIDVRTGKLKVKKITGDGNPIAAPVVGETRVCVASDKGEVTGFDTGTYEVKWKFKCDGGAVGVPAIGQGLVIVAGTDKLYTLNAVTGKVVRVSMNLPTGIVGAPAIAADKVYVATGDGNILALATSGNSLTELWKLEAGSNCTTGPVLAADGTLYAGTGEGLLAVDTQKKAKKWSYAMAVATDPQQEMMMRQRIIIMQRQGVGQQIANVGGPVPVIDNGVAYLSAGGKLQAVDTATGQGKWTFEPDVGQSADAGDDVNGRFQGRAIMIQRMRFPMGVAGGLSAPVIVGKTAYVGAPLGLFALEVKNGLQLWRFPTDTPVLGRPLVANETLLFGNGLDMSGNGMQVFRGGVQPASGQPAYAIFALPVKASSPAIPVAK
jgi:outer membrane protein assembly factor BamB